MAQIDLHPRAIFDARQARRYYGRVSADLAAQFVAELTATVVRIAANPATGSRHHHGTRMWRLHRFPYHVIYIEVGPDVLIVAVAHVRRRPTYWSRRLP
jgi:plasmid stabilization system protein ParE